MPSDVKGLIEKLVKELRAMKYISVPHLHATRIAHNKTVDECIETVLLLDRQHFNAPEGKGEACSMCDELATKAQYLLDNASFDAGCDGSYPLNEQTTIAINSLKESIAKYEARKQLPPRSESDTELKPCPFCGGKACVTHVKREFETCEICCAKDTCLHPSTGVLDTYADAGRKWNARTKC